jgi:tRNA 2-thiocytidine biosynthesis protein TtcA
MPPLLVSDDGRNTVIRPLCYAPESEVAAYAHRLEFPIIPCDLCGSQENLKRKEIKRLLDELESKIPNIRSSILAAMSNVRPSQLMDSVLWPLFRVGGKRLRPQASLLSQAHGEFGLGD